MAGDDKPKQNITDFDSLYRQAEESQPLYAATMNEYLAEIKERNPGVFDDVRFEQGPLKSRDRAVAKINGDYDSQTERISDLVRGRFVVTTAQQADILRKDISEHAPFHVEQIKDQFANPTDTYFRAVNSKIRLPNGHLAEFRVEYAGMLEASMGTHKLYEEIQEIDRRINTQHRDPTSVEIHLREQKLDEIKFIHDRAAVEGNLDPLLSEESRANVDAFRKRMGISVALPSLVQSSPAQGEQTMHQNPVPIIVPPNEHGPQQNPIPVLAPQGDRGQTPPPVMLTRPIPPASPEISPERVALPGKIGIAGAAGQLAFGPGLEAGLTAANDGNAGEIAKAALHGLANSALPGVTNGFENITQNNSHQNWVDQVLNAGTTATQGVAVGALVVAGGSAAAAPITGGTSLSVTAGSLAVAGASGVANLGIGLVHDVTYVTGVSQQGGVVTGLAHMAGELADSKVAHRVGDWVTGTQAPAHQPPMSPDMQRALGAALTCGLSTSIRCDTQHTGPEQVPVGQQQVPQHAQAAQGR